MYDDHQEHRRWHPTRSSTSTATPRPGPRPACARPWRKPRSATSSKARTPRPTPCRSASRRCWARKRPCSCPPAPCATRSRCSCTAGRATRSSPPTWRTSSRPRPAAARPLPARRPGRSRRERGIFSGARRRGGHPRTGGRHNPRSRLLAVEQTVNRGGGAVWPLDADRGGGGRGARAMVCPCIWTVPASSMRWSPAALPRQADGGAVRQRLGRPVEGAGLPGRRRARGPEGLHRRGVAVEAPHGRRASPVRHARRRRPLRAGPQRRAAGRGPRQRAAAGGDARQRFPASAS